MFAADWLPDARYARLLDMMAAAAPGAFRAVRVFGVLNSGEREDAFPTASGSAWPAPGAPKDFSAAFAALDALASRGLVRRVRPSGCEARPEDRSLEPDPIGRGLQRSRADGPGHGSGAARTCSGHRSSGVAGPGLARSVRMACPRAGARILAALASKLRPGRRAAIRCTPGQPRRLAGVAYPPAGRDARRQTRRNA